MDRARRPPRASKELNWPFGNSFLSNVTVLAWPGFVDVFRLTNQRERLCGAMSTLIEGNCVGEGGEGSIVVVAAFQVGSTLFRMAPDAIFEYFVPDETTTGLGKGGVFAYETGVYAVRISDCAHAF